MFIYFESILANISSLQPPIYCVLDMFFIVPTFRFLKLHFIFMHPTQIFHFIIGILHSLKKCVNIIETYIYLSQCTLFLWFDISHADGFGDCLIFSLSNPTLSCIKLVYHFPISKLKTVYVLLLSGAREHINSIEYNGIENRNSVEIA